MVYVIVLIILFIALLFNDYYTNKNMLKDFEKIQNEFNFQVSNKNIYEFLKNYYLSYRVIEKKNQVLYKIFYGNYLKTPIDIYFYLERIEDISSIYTIFSFENIFSNFELCLASKWQDQNKYIPTMNQYRKIQNKIINKKFIIKSNNHELVEYLLEHKFGDLLSNKKTKNVNLQLLSDKKLIIYYVGIRHYKFKDFLGIVYEMYNGLILDFNKYNEQRTPSTDK
jgi:hypothetical protein